MTDETVIDDAKLALSVLERLSTCDETMLCVAAGRARAALATALLALFPGEASSETTAAIEAR